MQITNDEYVKSEEDKIKRLFERDNVTFLNNKLVFIQDNGNTPNWELSQ